MMTIATAELLLSASEVEIQVTAGKAPTVSITAYTGGLMVVPGWGPVALDLAGLDAGAEQISLLADHDASLQGIVGHGRASIQDNKLFVNGTITNATESARQVVELAKSGFQFQASVGVAPDETERVRAGESVQINRQTIHAPRSGFTLVRSGTLREVSIVALGADASTSVTIAAKAKENTMNDTAILETAEDIRAKAVAEAERIKAIQKACNGMYQQIEARAIAEGWDIAQTHAACLHELRESRPKPLLVSSRNYAAPQQLLEASVLVHMGRGHLVEKHLGASMAQQAHDLRTTNLVDLCRASLEMEMRDVPRGRDAMIRAAMSTYSLPVALGNAANKILMDSYTESPASWRSFAAIKSANDFKQQIGLRPSDAGDLQQLAPGGEIKHGSIKEATYPFSVSTFAKMLTIDRTDIINDDLGVFDETARNLGKAAMRSLSDLVYQVLLANAGNFFDAGNGNYDAGAATALSSASLATGISKMLSQRDDENRDLDIRPRVLLVPPALEQTAKELLQSDFMQRAANDVPTGNSLKNALTLEVEPRLSNSARFTGTSTKAWYLFGSPADGALTVAFLQGQQVPTVEFFGMDSEPNKLACSWRVYFDYGATLADHRAAYRAKGEV